MPNSFAQSFARETLWNSWEPAGCTARRLATPNLDERLHPVLPLDLKSS